MTECSRIIMMMIEDQKTKVRCLPRFEQISPECRPELCKQQLLSRSLKQSFFKTSPAICKYNQSKDIAYMIKFQTPLNQKAKFALWQAFSKQTRETHVKEKVQNAIHIGMTGNPINHQYRKGPFSFIEESSFKISKQTSICTHKHRLETLVS